MFLIIFIMRTFPITFFGHILVFLVLSLNPDQCLGITVKVNSIQSLQIAINNAEPGDRIILNNGIYITTESIRIEKQGTAGRPITIEAETTRGVEIKGSKGFIIAAPSCYVIIKGFFLTHNTGNSFVEPGATNCIITRNVFECAPLNAGNKSYLTVSGDDNEISYNTFQNKKDEGQMVSVQGPGSDKMAKRVWIHHNFFYNFPPSGKNNCSAIQIGLSGRSMDSAFCVVEYNLFIKTEGENEGAICHKSCRNIIRFNTFGERSEEMSLRHGNKSEVYGNFFINTTGLRFSGDDHLIYNNYFKGCKKAIVCTNGDGEVNEGSKLTCHDRPDRVIVSYNTIIDCKSSFLMPGRENGLGATRITFSHNVILGGEPLSVIGKYTHPVWKDNILFNTTGGDMPAEGYKIAETTAKQSYILKPPESSNYSLIPDSNRPLTTSDVGPYAL